jgi:hypothetical protein
MLFFIFLFSTFSASAQEDPEESAEVVAYIDVPDNRIPAINISDWTIINIKVVDAYGINWSLLTTRFPVLSQYVWPIIHPTWKPFLGYSSLSFEPEIIEGDPRGWYARVTPSGITLADQGRIYDLKLEVQTDDIAVDYAVVVGIKVTRKNVYGVKSGVSYINIPVKASSLNNIKMDATVTNKEAAPFSYVYFDINVKNYGYYRDMFSLEFEAENGLIVSATEQLFVLDPGETDNIKINILTPEKLFDQGTPNTIEIYAKSSTDQTSTLIGTIVVVTRGIYISQLAIIIAIPIILVIVLIYLLFFYFRFNKISKYLLKPNKPWTIAEERKYLEELQKKNKDEYIKTIDMMKDEYKSSILWYKDQIKNLKPPNKADKTSSSDLIKNFFNNQKNNIKKIRKSKEKKKDEEIIEEKIKEERSTKDEKNLYNKIISFFPRRNQTEKEQDVDIEISKDDQVEDDKLLMDKNEEEKKIKRAKTLEIKKNREKEKTISKIKKIQERQKRKIK